MIYRRIIDCSGWGAFAPYDEQFDSLVDHIEYLSEKSDGWKWDGSPAANQESIVDVKRLLTSL